MRPELTFCVACGGLGAVGLALVFFSPDTALSGLLVLGAAALLAEC